MTSREVIKHILFLVLLFGVLIAAWHFAGLSPPDAITDHKESTQ